MRAAGARSALVDRRTFLRMAGAAWVATLESRPAFALSKTDAVFASGYMERDGSFGIAVLCATMNFSADPTPAASRR